MAVVGSDAAAEPSSHVLGNTNPSGHGHLEHGHGSGGSGGGQEVSPAMQHFTLSFSGVAFGHALFIEQPAPPSMLGMYTATLHFGFAAHNWQHASWVKILLLFLTPPISLP